MDQIVIDHVDKTKFLGVIITENVKWNAQLKTITNRFSKRYYITN